MKKECTIEQADQLIEAYYEGTTTKAEEQLLQDFLAREDIPQRFDTERTIFGYFAREKSTEATTELKPNQVNKPYRGPIFRMKPVIKWSLAAAVIVSAVLIVPKLIATRNVNVAYIDGVRLTDTNTIRSLAIASIQNMELNKDDVKSSLKVLNESSLIESQMEDFPSL